MLSAPKIEPNPPPFPPARLVPVDDPVAEMRRIYERLGIVPRNPSAVDESPLGEGVENWRAGRPCRDYGIDEIRFGWLMRLDCDGME